MARAAQAFYQLLLTLAALALLSAFVCVVLGVLGRELDFSIRGLDAYAGYSIAAALFLALPETFRRGEHIRVSLVLERLPAAGRAAMEWFCLLLGLGLSGYLAWFSCRLVWMSRQFNDVSQSADATPLWLPQLAMALGCVGLAVAMLDALIARAQGRAFFAPASSAAAHVE